MKIAGQTTLDAAVGSIWPLIFDPTALMQLLPGCEQVEQVAHGEYHGRMNLRIPAVAGTYDTYVKVLQVEELSFCRLQGEANGPGGSVRGQASFSLQPDASQTRIAYEGDAQISGPLAGMNPRFAEGVVQQLIKQGLGKLPELAREREAAMQVAPVAQLAAPSRPTRRWTSSLTAWFAGLWRRVTGRTSRRTRAGRSS